MRLLNILCSVVFCRKKAATSHQPSHLAQILTWNSNIGVTVKVPTSALHKLKRWCGFLIFCAQLCRKKQPFFFNPPTWLRFQLWIQNIPSLFSVQSGAVFTFYTPNMFVLGGDYNIFPVSFQNFLFSKMKFYFINLALQIRSHTLSCCSLANFRLN
jgi:hypothetical protein